MRKVILSMQMSLDGFAAGPNDEMDWLPPFQDQEAWRDIHEAMWAELRTVDTLLLGRVTYQIWEKYWPAAATNPASTPNDIKFSRYADETQKIVFSRTLDSIDWRNTRLIQKDIPPEIAKLKQQPGKNMVVAGGPGLAQTFMRLGLIDEYGVTVHPVLLGKGKPLFKDLSERINLRLVDTRRFGSGAAHLRYEAVTKEA